MKTIQFNDETYETILEMLTDRFYTTPDYQEAKQLTAAIIQMGVELDNDFFRILQKRVQST